MDLESQMVFTSKTPPVAAEVTTPDVLAEILFRFNPAILYQWVEDYSKSGRGAVLGSIPHLSQYWNGVFQRANVAEGSQLFDPNMTQQHWIDTFRNQALPLLRSNRKLFTHVNHH